MPLSRTYCSHWKDVQLSCRSGSFQTQALSHVIVRTNLSITRRDISDARQSLLHLRVSLSRRRQFQSLGSDANERCADRNTSRRDAFQIRRRGIFIAEQIGVPPLYQELWAYSDGPTESDHVWHEFFALRPAEGNDLAMGAPWGTAITLFTAVSGIARWNERLSPHREVTCR